MGLLIPEDLPTSYFNDVAERTVIQALERLPSSWIILPNLRLYKDYERELDVVLLHPRAGVILVEVKGFRPTVRGGAWYDEHGNLKSSPVDQAIRNSFALRDRVNERLGDKVLREVPSAVAFPRASSIEGTLPDDRQSFHFILEADLSDPDQLEDKIDRLAASTIWLNLDEFVINAIIAEVAPDTDFKWDAASEQRRTRDLLQRLSDQQIEGFASLDANRRVFVRGRAGTGKTRLATAWVKKAVFERQERVLLTCWNKPLGETFETQFSDYDGVVARPFLQLLCDYVGMDEPPAGADRDEWWDVLLPELAAKAIPEQEQLFDTIIIDEVQDFFPHWLDVANLLLDPSGPRRMLLLGDEQQDINGRGFDPPPLDAGWVHATMPRNCRNADVIARLLRRKFDGAKPSPAAPPGREPRFIPARDNDIACEKVGDVLDQLLGDEDRVAGTIGVIARGGLRDLITQTYGITQEPGEAIVSVGTAHRLKGLEFDTVILALVDQSPDDKALYIGVSRAVNELIVVGSKAVGERLGLIQPSDGDAD